MNHKKREKLLVQVGLVVSVIFLIIILVQTYERYQSTVRGYLVAQNNFISSNLKNVAAGTITEDEEWLLDKRSVKRKPPGRV